MKKLLFAAAGVLALTAPAFAGATIGGNAAPIGQYNSDHTLNPPGSIGQTVPGVVQILRDAGEPYGQALQQPQMGTNGDFSAPNGWTCSNGC
jgi:hypothetical protein